MNQILVTSDQVENGPGSLRAPIEVHLTARDLANMATILDSYFEPDVSARWSIGIRRGLAVAAATFRRPNVQTPKGRLPVDESATDEPFLVIPLRGKWGAGKSMLIDESVWHAGLANGWPLHWKLTRNHNADRFYVTTSKQPFANRRDGVRPLAQLVMQAKPGEIVKFRNSNTLDLRKRNLVNVTSAKTSPFIGAKRLPAI